MTSLNGMPTVPRTDLEHRDYPPEVRSWAYQLWAFEYGRNCAAVARRLAAPQPGDAIEDALDIPARTIIRWSQADNWPHRVHHDLKAVAPDLHESVTTNMLVSAVQLARYLVDVAHDRVPMSTMTEIMAVRVKHDIFRTVADRTGFIPWGMNSDKSRPTPPSRPYAEAIGQLSDEELHAKLYGPGTPALDDGDVDDS